MRFVVARLLALATLLVFCAATCASESDRDWAAVARADLDAMRRLIESTHPGSIDDENPAFRAWLDDGYRQASVLAARAQSAGDAKAVAGFYAAGFGDPHLGLRDVPGSDVPVAFAGWLVRRTRGKVVVSGAVKDWPAPLPPAGETLVECDGRSPDEIVDRDIAPYVDRRPALHDDLLPFLSRPLPSFVAPLRTCTFESAEGERIVVPVVMRTTAPADIVPLTGRGAERQAQGRTAERFGDVLWVRLPSFGLDGVGTDALRRTLKEAPRDAIRTIVFDVRGNGGGDSDIGDMALTILTGGLDYDEKALADRPPTYALWRVSPVSITQLEADAKAAAKRFGEASAPANEMRALVAASTRAAAASEPWIVQYDGDHRVTRADVVSVGGHLRDFHGTVAVLTDGRCVSACLDFVDEIRLVPGSLHLGRTTDADTNYIDIARRTLPSGSTLIVPMKVWRNRVRASGERLVPDRAFDGDIGDDAQVRPWVLDVLRAGRPD